MENVRLVHLGQWVHHFYFNKKTKHISLSIGVIPKKMLRAAG